MSLGPGPAADFVRAALQESGHGGLAPFIVVNGVGDPAFLGRLIDPQDLTVDDLDAVIRAFDLWHGPSPRQTESGYWAGRQPGDAEEWLARILAT